MEKSRVSKSKKNITFGIIYQVITLFVNFIVRTIFIRMLSSDFLGMNGLFNNILSILSLAELGIGHAIVFSMYKPLKEKDYKKLAEINCFYKSVYRIIGFIVLLLGLLVLPFLRYILNFDHEVQNVSLYYILFLLNSVSSYFLIYKTSIVEADQNGYLLKIVNMIFNIFKLIGQILSLTIFKSYFAYLIIQLVISILTNFTNSIIAEKKYPFIKEKKELPKEEKKTIFENVKSLFMYQIGGVVLNNTDNIIISMICGTAIVGIYSNYCMIISAIETTLSMIFTSIVSSIGNFNVEKSNEEQHKLFKSLNMVATWIYGFCSICFLIIFQNFISIWAGEEYLLPYEVVIISVINFYIRGMLYPIWCYRNTTKLFTTTNNIMLVAALINIIFSIILGKFIGIFGILLATALSRLLTNVWYEPYILYKDFFKNDVKKYYITNIVNLAFITIVFIITYLICSNINIANAWLKLIVDGIVCLIFVNAVLYIRYRNNEEFNYLLVKFLKINKKKGE